MKLNLIDEKSGNPFPAQLAIFEPTILPVSREGYHHNEQLIKKTTKELAKIVDLKPGQKTIDVGYGSNLSVAEAMHELGMDAYCLDSGDGLDIAKYPNRLFVPPYFNVEENGVKKYCGTIEDITHRESQLRNTKFDLITLWGSWESGGSYNFAIGGEQGEFRVMKENPNLVLKYPCEELYDLLQKNKEKIIKNCRTILNPMGGILVVSSRYAYHGGGFTTNELPAEKRLSLRLAQNLEENGSSEIYLIGLSKDEVGKQLEKCSKFNICGQKRALPLLISSSTPLNCSNTHLHSASERIILSVAPGMVSTTVNSVNSDLVSPANSSIWRI